MIAKLLTRNERLKFDELREFIYLTKTTFLLWLADGSTDAPRTGT
jgi:hypothetical protein